MVAPAVWTSRTTAERPPSKQQKIVMAAKSVFLRLGYGAASMDMIASEAHVSKQTIYNHFRSKEELFRAIVSDISSNLSAPLSLRDDASSHPRQQLTRFGREFYDHMLKPTSLAFYRLVVAESARFPELGPTIYEAGTGYLIRTLAGYLAWQNERGSLRIEEPEAAAEQFIGMLSGRVQLRALLGIPAGSSGPDLTRRLEHAVESFLTLYAPSGRC